jgi:putative membrane protein
MMWGVYDGWSWLWMAAMMLLFWGGIAALAVFIVRAIAVPRSRDDAMDVLRRRLANGEISQDEFEKTRKLLQS